MDWLLPLLSSPRKVNKFLLYNSFQIKLTFVNWVLLEEIIEAKSMIIVEFGVFYAINIIYTYKFLF
jgi:hypothetical protein